MARKKKRTYQRKKEELKSELAWDWISNFALQELPGKRQKEWDDLFESVDLLPSGAVAFFLLSE